MSDRLHLGTFLSGVILTIVGAVLTAVGFGWWDLGGPGLRYVAPVLVILIGGVILVTAFVPDADDQSTTSQHG